MKLTALMTLLAALTISTVTAAETTTTTTSNSSSSSLKSFYSKVKESPFSMAYLNDTFSELHIDGITSYHYLYNHYKINKKNKISIIPSFKSDLASETPGTNEKTNHTRYNSTQLRYSYSGLLNQNDHGVGLSVQARYYINGSTNAESSGSDGYGRILLLGSRTFGKSTFSFNTDSVLYNKNSSSAANTHYNKVGLGYGYSITDSISASGGLNWYKFSANNSDDINEYSYYSLSLDFSTPIGISITPYLEGVVTQAQDDRSGLTSDIVRNSSVGLSLYYSWF